MVALTKFVFMVGVLETYANTADTEWSNRTAPSRQCDGFDEEVGACPLLPPCKSCRPQNCEFRPWGDWSDSEGGCSGIRTRQRAISRSNNECGKPCSGAKVMSERIHEPGCAAAAAAVDCRMGDWGKWTVCATQEDQSTRVRSILDHASRGGIPCKSELEITRPCWEAPKPVDCVFDEWREWTTCSTTCGKGRFTKMRRITVTASDGGKPCEGPKLLTSDCNVEDCRSTDCIMEQWSDWSSCDSESAKYRGRKPAMSAAGDGLACNGTTKEAARCIPDEAKPCVLSDWSDWGKCSENCGGGIREKTRSLVSPQMENGECSAAALKVTDACNTFFCQVPRDCHLSEWTEWSKCDNQCGVGSSMKVRKVTQLAKYGGESCTGFTKEVKECKSDNDCTGVDCLWADWSDWNACSCDCGGGSKRRDRSMAQRPSGNGKLCDVVNKSEVFPCNTQQCGNGCVDGAWDAWTSWGDCSATCGSGYKSRSRAVAQQANHCGEPVIGAKIEFGVCADLTPCGNDQDCIVGHWSNWADCSCSCFGVTERTRQIGQFVQGNGKPCIDEDLREISPCNPLPGDQVNAACGDEPMRPCKWNEWTKWADCSQECGGGQKKKVRFIAEHATGGGKQCEGANVITEPCNTHACDEVVCQDCTWEAWGEWGMCTKCGGQRVRHRGIKSLPNHCGKMCDTGASREITNCTNHCANVLTCRWSEWSDGGFCLDGCSAQGQIITRNRALGFSNDPISPEQYMFNGSSQSQCSGSQIMLQACDVSGDDCPGVIKCSPQDCIFTEWQDWGIGSCEGLCQRQRVIKSPNNECGAPCAGVLEDTKRCTPNCDLPTPCVFSDWTGWTKAVLTDSIDEAKVEDQCEARRVVLQYPERNGEPCNGPLHKLDSCGDKPDAQIDCQLDIWTPYSVCSVACGGGLQHRSRNITREASILGVLCSGAMGESRVCNLESCDGVNCELGSWEDWTGCQQDGQHYRERSIATPASSGGLACEGGFAETMSCIHEVVNCSDSPWTEWDACTVTCGTGQQNRQRQIEVFDQNGGEKCPEVLMEMRGCTDVKPCHSQDCSVGSWSGWGACSSVCGIGVEIRSREMFGFRTERGEGCNDVMEEKRVCEGKTCNRVDCEWFDWDGWSDCSCSCDGGQRTRTRRINKYPTHGGDHCEDLDKEEVVPCNTQKCGHCVDGKFQVWSPWSECSVSCNVGVKSRQRDIGVTANHCGTPAVGSVREMEFCDTKTDCNAPVDCEFGDWGGWSDCSASCDGVADRHRQVSTYGYGDGDWCIGALREVKPCNPGVDTTDAKILLMGCGTIPQDCKLGDWAEWETCPATCAGGIQSRIRDIDIYPKAGGLSCEDTLKEVRECNRNACDVDDTPENCEVGEWGEWGGCYKCGGIRKRLRSIIKYPNRWGKACPEEQDMEEVGECDRKCHDKVFCTWQNWQNWGECSSKCGEGRRTRRRYLEANSVFDAMNKTPVNIDEMMEEYSTLVTRTRSMQSGYVQDLVLSFSCGGFSILMGLGIWRQVASRARSNLVDPEAEAMLGEQRTLRVDVQTATV